MADRQIPDFSGIRHSNTTDFLFSILFFGVLVNLNVKKMIICGKAHESMLFC